ncbi:MAG: hypothetical protein C4294_06950 [Nitrospiraceae bacterium]
MDFPVSQRFLVLVALSEKGLNEYLTVKLAQAILLVHPRLIGAVWFAVGQFAIPNEDIVEE